MNLTYIDAFVAAMHSKDLDAMLTQMVEDVILRTPLAATPLEGKATIRPVVEALLRAVDRFDVREILQGPEHAAAFFGIKVGPNELDGVDFWRLDDAGRIKEMTVLWRPLPAAIAVREMLAQSTEVPAWDGSDLSQRQWQSA